MANSFSLLEHDDCEKKVVDVQKGGKLGRGVRKKEGSKVFSPSYK